MGGTTRILVAVDFSQHARYALEHAVRLATRAPSIIEVLHAVPPPLHLVAQVGLRLNLPGRDQTLGAIAREEAAAKMTELLDSIELPKDVSVGMRIQPGPPAEVITQAARGFDLIVMGTHGRSGPSRLLLGSVADGVVRAALCPVLTVREPPPTSVRRILVPVDFSTGAKDAFAHASRMARLEGASVDLLFASPAPSELGTLTAASEGAVTAAALAEASTDRMSALVDALGTTPGVEVRTHVQIGPAAEVIINASTGYDLVVIATHGRTGIARFAVGSVATKVVRGAHCPVLTTRLGPEGLEQERRAQAAAADPEETLYALFDSIEAVAGAYRALREANVPDDAINLVLDNRDLEARVSLADRSHTIDGAATGGLLGGAVGSAVTVLTALTAGVGGIASIAVLGPAIGLAIAGGLVGALTGMGFSTDQAEKAQVNLLNGGALVGVRLTDRAALARAQEVLFNAGGEHVELTS